MSAPLVTVLMAVHNGGAYLAGAVDSVLAQEFKDFELLVIDDGSTDGAVETIRRRDPRIRIHRNSVNRGQTVSLNAGLSLARGAFVARMDADDMAYGQWLGRQAEFLRGHPDCAAISCAAVVMDEDGRVYKKLRSPLFSCDMILKSFFASPLNHVGCLMRRQMILDHGGYDDSLRIAADYDLWSRLLRRGMRLGAVPRVGVAIRAHRASVTASNKGGADVPEVCRIMGANIRHFSGLDLEEGSLRLWWGYVYDPASLSGQEFAAAEGLMTRIYGQARAELIGCSDGHIRRFTRGQKRIFFLKALFDRSRRGQPAAGCWPLRLAAGAHDLLRKCQAVVDHRVRG